MDPQRVAAEVVEEVVAGSCLGEAPHWKELLVHQHQLMAVAAEDIRTAVDLPMCVRDDEGEDAAAGGDAGVGADAAGDAHACRDNAVEEGRDGDDADDEAVEQGTCNWNQEAEVGTQRDHPLEEEGLLSFQEEVDLQGSRYHPSCCDGEGGGDTKQAASCWVLVGICHKTQDEQQAPATASCSFWQHHHHHLWSPWTVSSCCCCYCCS